MKLLVNDRVPLDELLTAARSAGELRQFSYQPPRLSELFMEAVAGPADEPAEVSR
jgi:hypothetical protein